MRNLKFSQIFITIVNDITKDCILAANRICSLSSQVRARTFKSKMHQAESFDFTIRLVAIIKQYNTTIQYNNFYF